MPRVRQKKSADLFWLASETETVFSIGYEECEAFNAIAAGRPSAKAVTLFTLCIQQNDDGSAGE
jgi:hypothetical protein